jgi:type II secretory pathway predicted ATPase ExeA
MAVPTSLKSFFGFTRHPFPPSCPPEPLFRHAALDAAIEQAKNAIASRFHVLVTAPAGLGKSSFLRLLAGELNPRDVRAVRMAGQGTGAMELVFKISDELGLETSVRSRSAAVKLLVAGLKRLSSSGPFPVALIDEAQNLPVGALDLVRVAAEEAAPPLIAFVLAGDESLRRALAKPACAPLLGRLAARVRLEPFGENETEAFVAHAFRAVGMQNLLAPSSVATVHAASGGSPRGIGAILARAMNVALEKKSRLLTDEIVQEVIDDRAA